MFVAPADGAFIQLSGNIQRKRCIVKGDLCSYVIAEGALLAPAADVGFHIGGAGKPIAAHFSGFQPAGTGNITQVLGA